MGHRRYPAAGGIGGLRRAAGRQPAGSIIPIADADGYHHTADGNRYPVANADSNPCANANFYPHAGAYRYPDANVNPDGDGDAHARTNPNPHAVARCAAGSHRRCRLCR